MDDTPTVGDALQTSLPGAEEGPEPTVGDSPFLQAALKILLDHQAEPIPHVLYHYTTAEGLLGIVGEDTLRFSDTKFVNDGSEMAWGRLVLEEHLKHRFATSPEPQQQFWHTVNALVARSSETFRHVIFCLSREGNLLNQWRDYGRDVVPYSIGLDSTYFMADKPMGNFDTAVTPMIYKVADQMKLVEAVVSKICDLMEPRNDRQPDQLLDDAHYASYELGWIIAQFKNPAFEPEQEVRLQLSHYRLTQALAVKPKFRSSILGLVPYYEWKPLKGRLPVKHVIVGPSPHAPASHESLKIYLQQQELPDVETTHSTIPIRR